MSKFLDEIFITVKAGSGGAGSVSFHSAKFLERGGPDGGDGGDGGNIYFSPQESALNLSHLTKSKKYLAGDGHDGKGGLKTGKKGEDLYIPIPLGCQISEYNEETNEYSFIQDVLNQDPILLLKGARGGKGNAFFKSSTNQTPRHAQPGERTESSHFFLSLKLIANVGFVGFPNSGKSTLLAALTNATPKIGNYAFTTLKPNIARLTLSHTQTITLADIPGILEDASKGYGLGISFLKHIERVQLILFVLDVSQANIEVELNILRNELKSYSLELTQKPYFIVINKIDLINDKIFLKEYLNTFPEILKKSICISASKQKGLENLKKKLLIYFETNHETS